MAERSARDALMDATEYLVAERGMAVSLREIAAYAGQRNNSAVIYHFGSHDGLIKATLERRMSGLEQRRRALLAELDAMPAYSIGDVVRAIVDPALEIPYAEGATHYARFIEQIRTHPIISRAVPSSETWPAVMMLVKRLRALMPADDKRSHARRIQMLTTVLFALMADYERRGELGTRRGRTRASAELVAALSALLTAPM